MDPIAIEDEHDDPVQQYLARMRRRWEQRARLHHRYFTESAHFDDPDAWDANARAETELLIRGLDKNALARGRCLEIGCGPGRILSQLAPRVATAIGVDISPTMLCEAQATCAGLDNVSLVRTGGAGLAMFPTASFDFAFMLSVAIHLPRELITHYVNEVHRVLRPGGRFRFTAYRHPQKDDNVVYADFIDTVARKIPAGAEDLVVGDDYVGHVFTDDEMAAFVAECGYAHGEIHLVGPWNFGIDLTR